MAKILAEWFNVCSGCEISILNIGDVLVDLLPQLEFVHMPVIMDHKYYGQMGDKEKLELPEADVGILTGGIRNEEHVEIAEEVRKKVKILIALGTCATNGGIPAMMNMWKNDDLLDVYYRGTVTTDAADNPTDVPPLLDRVYGIDEKVKVDIYLPGCPPHPDWIAEAIGALLKGETSFALPERSVCDTCPVIREKKAVTQDIKRPFENYEYNPEEPIDKMRCIMELGYLCLGPVTIAGCAGKEGVPRCIQGRMACRGCFGPIRRDANPMVDMMTALTSVGQNARAVIDRRAIMNRFVGSHNKLRPLPGK